MIVENLGPHAEHEVNGYRNQRDFGLNTSSMQSWQIAISGGMSTAAVSSFTSSDFSIKKSVNSPVASVHSTLIVSIRETDGAFFMT